MSGELGDVEAERADEAKLRHYRDAHGLVMGECPACLPGASAGCKTCDGDGALFCMSEPLPCGPDCPIVLDVAREAAP